MKMDQEQTINELKKKLPDIERMLMLPESPIKVTQTPTGLLVMNNGDSMRFTDEQIKGLEIYLNLVMIFNGKEEATSGGFTSNTGPQ